MKKMAFLLLMIFATVQIAPAVVSVFAETISVFIADEEKGEEKAGSTDKKEKKDYAAFSSHSAKLTHKTNTAFRLAEKIHLSPCLEELNPPPNFC